MTHPVSSGQSYTVHPTAITVTICHDRKPINVQIILSANVIKYQIQTKYVQFGVIHPTRYPCWRCSTSTLNTGPRFFADFSSHVLYNVGNVSHHECGYFRDTGLTTRAREDDSVLRCVIFILPQWVLRYWKCNSYSSLTIVQCQWWGGSTAGPGARREPGVGIMIIWLSGLWELNR